jgi:CubicO group peptidase (beta-lactamase class C family)
MPTTLRRTSLLTPTLTLTLALAAMPGLAVPATLADAERALAGCRTAVERESADEAAELAARAEEAFERALASDPVRSHLGLARTLLECRIEAAPMLEKAVLMQRIEHHLGAVLERDPDHLEARFLYGALLWGAPPFLGRTDDAIGHFETLLEGAESRGETATAEAYLYLGDLYARKDRREDARATWERGRKLYPRVDAFEERLATEPPDAAEPPSKPTSAPGAAGSEESRGAGSQAIRLRLEAEVARPEIPGLAVALARGEEVLLLEGFGLADLENGVAMTPDSVVRIGSISKQFAAATALRLVEEGALDVDGAAARWLPEQRRALAGITVRHLLNHTAGLPQDAVGAADWLERSLAEPRVGEPGERYAYSNLGYALLGRILEAAGGEAYPALLERLVLGRAGLRATRPCDERAIVPHRAQGYAWRGDRLLNDDPVLATPSLLYAGGLCSTARDLLRWQRALHGGEVLGADAYALLVEIPGVRDPAGTTYAAGLRVHAPRGRRVLQHSGGITGFLTEVAYYPATRLAIVVLTNSDAASPRALGFELAEMTLRG